MLYFGPNQRIVIGTNATTSKYDNDVKDAIIELNRSKVGSAFLDALDADPAGRKVTIVPRQETEKGNAGTDVDLTNATTTQQIAKVVANATPRGEVLVSQRHVICAGGMIINRAGRLDGKTITGTGVGADAIIQFDPTDWPVWAYTEFPARVILHELTHALRKMRGLAQNNMTCDDFLDLDEFFGIMMENIYVSELRKNGKPLLQYRANHRPPFRVLSDDLARSRPFFQRYKDRIQEFVKEFANLAAALKKFADLEFNPLTV
jgi:hypothetical protein